MKVKSTRLRAGLCSGVLGLLCVLLPRPAHGGASLPKADGLPSKHVETIPWSQLGARAGANLTGEGLAVTPTTNGARLSCVFQRLEGEATGEGLWLTSTVTPQAKDRFRVTTTALGRAGSPPPTDGAHGVPRPTQLPATGNISVDGNTVRFTRPGLMEEYSVSMDGVRQDFVVLERPQAAASSRPSRAVGEKVAGRPVEGELRLELSVTSAAVEPIAGGARLVLEKSGREIAYSRLKVTDANGKELPARIEVGRVAPRAPLTSKTGDDSEIGCGAHGVTRPTLAILVDDADATYPVRIDPTFSDANWISMGGVPGADGIVYAAAVDDSGNLYIGGGFTVVGDIVANGIAKWNGSSWSALGSGVGAHTFNDLNVSALAVSGSDLYAGGYFTTAGDVVASNIAKWNGSNWSALGSGIDGGVRALAMSGSDLYVGGGFTTAGGVSATNIAKWDGATWSALGLGISGGMGLPFDLFYPVGVFGLAVSGSDVFVGGRFTNAGGMAAANIAKWNGSAWSALGQGLNESVTALAVSGSEVYAGGSFTMAGGVPANCVAKWNGSAWSALGSGMAGGNYTGTRVSALVATGTNLYAAGEFTTAGGIPANHIAQWDGSSWRSLGSGMGYITYALTVSGSAVYAGGQFSSAGGSAANCVAKWDGSAWSALGSGTDGLVSALAVSGGDVYAGGSFTTIAGSPANFVAKWDGSAWSALGSGTDGLVSAVAVSGSDLYAGGGFTMAGGVSATNIAKWNGSNWSAMASGLPGYVTALAVSGSDVYVGSRVIDAGGWPAHRIAKWNGSSWIPLGSGMNDYVNALAAAGNDLYAAGWFSTAGGVSVNRIAKWNGSSWSALGSGMNLDELSWVNALAVAGGNLYAGGKFTMAGGIAAANIAKWNGSNWSALGAGIPGPYSLVRALAVSGSDLYVAGNFTIAGAVSAANIAKWNGHSWSALGSGLGGFGPDTFVSALALSGSDLYAGGWFTTAGDKASAFLARAFLPDIPELSIGRSGTGFTLSWPSAGTDGFKLEQSLSLGNPAGWIPNSDPVTDDGTIRSVIVPVTASRQFFRLRRP